MARVERLPDRRVEQFRVHQAVLFAFAVSAFGEAIPAGEHAPIGYLKYNIQPVDLIEFVYERVRSGHIAWNGIRQDTAFPAAISAQRCHISPVGGRCLCGRAYYLQLSPC